MEASIGRSAQSGSREPTVPPPQPVGLASALRRNIEAMRRRRQEEERSTPLQERIAIAITRFSGSMIFVYLHLAAVLFWVAANLSWLPGLEPWDPSFVVLAMIASVEAIFLSTFVLISQNRMAAAADKRADLDLQINLLAEHEVTRLVAMCEAITKQLGIEEPQDAEVQELKRDVAPEVVLDALDDEAEPLEADQRR